MAVNNLNWSLDFYEEHIEECNTVLNSLDDYNEIPLLDSVSFQALSDGMLVRYRGMIQDMMNPEYYSCSFTVINKENNESYVKSGKYRDIASCKANEELRLKEVDFIPRERLLFFCIPIPGTNDWVHNLQKTQISCEQNDSSSSFLKRTASNVDADAEMDTDTSELIPEISTKRIRSSAVQADSNLLNSIYDNSNYFPIPKKNGLPCIIKVYDEEEKSGFLLNDCVEVMGFLSVSLALEANLENTDTEDKAIHPPPSLVPRIHAILVKKLRHCNPLLKQIVSSDNYVQLAENARSDLHLVLTQLLFEDALAADYVICNLISRVYIRTENTAVGKFSLNLFNICLKNFAEDFYNILKNVVTNSHYIPLTINLLNEKNFVPRKNYETNRLHSGMLQLPNEVHLILDETKMREGHLNNTGCLNIAALQKLFREQEIDYDFEYYPVKYNTDIPLLVISEGKSMFQADIRLKVKSELCTNANFKESLEAVRLYLSTDVINKIRIYLTAARLQDFKLSEAMVQKIGEDYVSLRQQDREVNSSDLHTLLVLSRLLALSHGRTILEPSDWAQAVGMEAERKLRLK